MKGIKIGIWLLLLCCIPVIILCPMMLRSTSRKKVTADDISQVHGAAMLEVVTPHIPSEYFFKQSQTIVADGVKLRDYMLHDTEFVSLDDLQTALKNFSWWREAAKDYIRCKNQNEILRIPKYDYEGSVIRTDCAVSLQHKKKTLVPMNTVKKLRSLEMLRDTAQNTTYLSESLDKTQIEYGKKVPILMYHCISDDIWGGKAMFTSPKAFREQMDFLLKNGYQPILFSDLSHLEDYDKPVIITLDDGYQDNYENVFPYIKEHKIPVTIFVISDFVGRNRYLTQQQVKEMSDSGLVSIQSHTANHMRLPQDSAAQQEESMKRSVLDLARMTGKIPYVLSYPEGRYDSCTEQLAQKYFELAVTTKNTRWSSNQTYYRIVRLSMYRDTPLSEYQKILEGKTVGKPKK